MCAFKVFLYTINDSVKGDANFNIEGIRLTLFHRYSHKRIPATMLIQADNAGAHTHDHKHTHNHTHTMHT